MNHYSTLIRDVADRLIPARVKGSNRTAQRKEISKLIRDNTQWSGNFVIENPKFETQAKRKLTSKPNEWGSKPDFSEQTVRKILPFCRKIVAEAQ